MNGTLAFWLLVALVLVPQAIEWWRTRHEEPDGPFSAAEVLCVSVVAFTVLGSFAWGWDVLGPVFNRYF